MRPDSTAKTICAESPERAAKRVSRRLVAFWESDPGSANSSENEPPKLAASTTIATSATTQTPIVRQPRAAQAWARRESAPERTWGSGEACGTGVLR